jgi:PAS domain S-box-containing protein
MKDTSNKTLSINKYRFLAGGGEMGALIRGKDWSSTVIGDPETWPQSLKISLGIILNSKFPMFLWWGPQLICFYNDAYRPSLGQNGKHSSILGLPARSAWPEIWDIIKPLIDQVLAGGEATWSENQLIPIYRNGNIEDVYWTFSYSPVFDESGNVAGVLVTCNETTEQVTARKKIDESEVRFRTMAEGSDILISVSDETRNATYFNKAWVELTGRPVKDLLKFGWADLFHPDDREKTLNIYVKAFEKQIRFTCEFRLLNKYGEYNWIFAKTHPRLHADGSFAGYITTCIDITERKQAEEEIKRFKFMADNASDPFILMNENGTFEYLNKSALGKWGYTAEEVKDITVPDVDTAYKEAAFKALFNKAQNEIIPPFETIHTMKDGSAYPVEANVSGLILGEKPYLFAVARDISDRKKTEQVLRAGEQRFRNLILQSPVPMAIFRGEEYVIEMANPAMLERWEKTEDKVLGKNFLNEFPELKNQKFPDLLNEVYNTGKPHRENESEVYFNHKEGLKKHYVDFEYAPLFEEAGGVWGILVTVNDLTEKVEARKKLEENEERLNIIIKASELGTWELDLKTDKCSFSKRYLEIFGAKEGVSRTHSTFLSQIHPDDRQIRNKAFDEALKTSMLHYMVRFIWDDQSVHWMDVKGKVFYDDKNQPLKLIGTIRDATEEKHHQLELIEREEKFRLLADSIPQLVWTADAGGNINYFNKSVLDYSGLHLKQIIKDGWIQLVYPDDLQDNINAWTDSVKTGNDFLYEHRFKRFDGEYRWQLSRAIPQKDASGNIQMWVGSSTDIQQIKEQEQQKDYFISVASHELKTPITSMKGYVQMLKRKYNDSNDPFLKKSLQVIDKQIATLTGLISELLDISKIKSGRLYLKKEPFEINGLIEAVIEEVNQINPDYNILFSKENDILINADRERIGQVLINFLTNAIKYSPNSSIVEVKSTVEGEQIIISVIDTGIGISKHDQERIFERFFRVEGKNEKNFPGFGIGLFIASEIVHRHNGKIGVKSEPGRGSVFYFSIPFDSK